VIEVAYRLGRLVVRGSTLSRPTAPRCRFPAGKRPGAPGRVPPASPVSRSRLISVLRWILGAGIPV